MRVVGWMLGIVLGAWCLATAANAAAGAGASLQAAEDREMMITWTEQNRQCERASVPNGPSCRVRDTLSRQLKERGWCGPPDWTACQDRAATQDEDDLSRERVNSRSAQPNVPVAQASARTEREVGQPELAVPPAQSEAAPSTFDETDSAAELEPDAAGMPSSAATAEPIPAADRTAVAAVGGGLVSLFVVAGLFLLGIYFLPTIIAILRKHPNLLPIVALNLLIGWTFVGWVVAFVWSLTSQAPQTIIVQAPGRDRI